MLVPVFPLQYKFTEHPLCARTCVGFGEQEVSESRGGSRGEIWAARKCFVGHLCVLRAPPVQGTLELSLKGV